MHVKPPPPPNLRLPADDEMCLYIFSNFLINSLIHPCSCPLPAGMLLWIGEQTELVEYPVGSLEGIRGSAELGTFFFFLMVKSNTAGKLHK